MLVGSVICNGVTYHLARAAMRGCSPATFSALNGFSTVVVFLVLGAMWRMAGARANNIQAVSPASVGRWFRDARWLAVLATFAAGTGNILLQACNKHYGPEITAFLANQTMVLLIIGGVLLGDRIGVREAVTMAAIVAGALMFSYRGGQFAWAALGLMFLACAGTAIKQMSVARASAKAALPVVMCGIQLGNAVWSIVIALATQTFSWPDAVTWGYMVASSVVGNCLGMMLLYGGFLVVGVARGASLDAMRPLVVLTIGMILGSIMPGPMQIVGGTLIILGSITLARLHVRPKVVTVNAQQP